MKQKWLDALDAAEAFIQARPASEVGCLYYSPRLETFPRSISSADDLVPHYGRPGGVLPIVG